METLLHRPLTLSELYHLDSGMFSSSALPAPAIRPILSQGIVPAASALPPKSQAVLLKPAIFKTITNFVSRNRYSFMLMGVGLIVLGLGIRSANEERKKEKRC
jgi:hypothetical protein